VKKKQLRKLAIIAFFVFSFVIRVFNLGKIPANFTGDEVEQYNQVLMVKNEDLGAMDLCFANHHACFFSKLYFVSLTIFKNISFSLRLPQALLSFASVVLFYLIVKKRFGFWPGILSSFLFSTSLWHLNFTRSVWSNIWAVFLFLLGYYLIDNFSSKGSRFPILILIFVFWLLLLGYPAGYLVAIFLLGFSFFKRPFNKKGMGVVFLLFLAGLMFSLPYFLNAWEEKELFLRRFQRTSYLKTKSEYPDALKLERSEEIFKYQARVIARGVWLVLPTRSYNMETDRYYDEAIGLINLFSRLFYFLGLGIFLFKPKKDFFWAGVLISGGIFSFLSVFPPNPARIIFLLPVYYFFIAKSLNWLWFKMKSDNLKKGLLIMFLLAGGCNLYHYFTWIGDRETLDSRQPAIKVEDLFLFSKLSEDKILKGGFPVSVGDWLSEELLLEYNIIE